MATAASTRKRAARDDEATSDPSDGVTQEGLGRTVLLPSSRGCTPRIDGAMTRSRQSAPTDAIRRSGVASSRGDLSG